MGNIFSGLRKIQADLDVLWRFMKGSPSFGWAVVTSVNPLRIRYDGEATPVAGSPSGDTAGLQVGDRVWCQRINRRDIVLVGGHNGKEHTTPPSLKNSQMIPVCTFPARPSGATPWPQGFDINHADQEIYVASIDGDTLRIDVRDLSTGFRKSHRTVTVDNGTFTQSLNWHRNSAGELCFIIWPVAHDSGAISSQYRILNYDTGGMSAPVTIRGKTMGCRDGDTYVTGYINAYEAFQFNIYSWQSVIEGSPSLIKTVTISNPGLTNGKTQGIAALNGDLFITMGAQGEVPAITSYDPNGNLVREDSWQLGPFGEMLNATYPGLTSGDSYLYENEGATSADGHVYTLHIVGGQCVVVKHGAGTYVHSSPGQSSPEWIEIPTSALAPGVAQVSSDPGRVMMKDGRVYMAGQLSAPGFEYQGTYHHLFSLSGPLYYYRPKSVEGYARSERFEVGGNTTAKRTIQVERSGIVGLFTTAQTGNPISLSQINYSII